MALLLFAGVDYHPGGGAYDLIGQVLSAEEADHLLTLALPYGEEAWAHVFDTAAGAVVARWTIKANFNGTMGEWVRQDVERVRPAWSPDDWQQPAREAVKAAYAAVEAAAVG